MILPETISRCVRPQFVWDKKSVFRWHICNIGTGSARGEYFCRELGILVFLNLAEIKQVPRKMVQDYLKLESAQMERLIYQLQQVLQAGIHDEEMTRLRNDLIRKTGLAKNCMAFHNLD